jgi:hypothetical protein
MSISLFKNIHTVLRQGAHSSNHVTRPVLSVIWVLPFLLPLHCYVIVSKNWGEKILHLVPFPCFSCEIYSVAIILSSLSAFSLDNNLPHRTLQRNTKQTNIQLSVMHLSFQQDVCHKRQIAVAARYKTWTAFIRTLGSWVRIVVKAWMSVLYSFILCLYCSLYRQRPCDRLIPRPRSSTDCV